MGIAVAHGQFGVSLWSKDALGMQAKVGSVWHAESTALAVAATKDAGGRQVLLACGLDGELVAINPRDGSLLGSSSPLPWPGQPRLTSSAGHVWLWAQDRVWKVEVSADGVPTCTSCGSATAASALGCAGAFPVVWGDESGSIALAGGPAIQALSGKVAACSCIASNALPTVTCHSSVWLCVSRAGELVVALLTQRSSADAFHWTLLARETLPCRLLCCVPIQGCTGESGDSDTFYAAVGGTSGLWHVQCKLQVEMGPPPDSALRSIGVTVTCTAMQPAPTDWVVDLVQCEDVLIGAQVDAAAGLGLWGVAPPPAPGNAAAPAS